MLNSCVYQVSVMHQRLAPRRHRFQYGMFMFLLDINEADSVNSRLSLAKFNQGALYSFFDQDHFDLKQVPIREKLCAFLRSQGVHEPIGRILLLTNLRFLGYVFNPVSIYFVHDVDGQPIAAVAEVGNTFLERKPYLVPVSKRESNGKPIFSLTVPKQFYVSPFSNVDDTFEFVFESPDESISININTRIADRIILASTLSGTRLELSDANLMRCTLRFPFVTFGVIFFIHFHALLLWLKRVPFFRKEDKAELQTGLINPHRSLTDSRGVAP